MGAKRSLDDNPIQPHIFENAPLAQSMSFMDCAPNGPIGLYPW